MNIINWQSLFVKILSPSLLKFLLEIYVFGAVFKYLGHCKLDFINFKRISIQINLDIKMLNKGGTYQTHLITLGSCCCCYHQVTSLRSKLCSELNLKVTNSESEYSKFRKIEWSPRFLLNEEFVPSGPIRVYNVSRFQPKQLLILHFFVSVPQIPAR